jgi:sugar phosphate permease
LLYSFELMGLFSSRFFGWISSVIFDISSENLLLLMTVLIFWPYLSVWRRENRILYLLPSSDYVTPNFLSFFILIFLCTFCF